MKYLFSALVMVSMSFSACQPTVKDYQSMTPAQKQNFMAKYEKDMMKVHSLANRMGKMKTTYVADASTDTITMTMIFGMETKGMGDAMANQVSEMMLEQNCKERFMRDFVEAGITYRMVMKDLKGNMMTNMVVSPEKCAKYSG